MRTEPKNFAVWPRVVPTGSATELTVLPTENAFLFREDTEYTVLPVPVNEDIEDVHAPLPVQRILVRGKGGALRFFHTFSREQEYDLIVFEGERKLAVLPLFALKEDLFFLRPLKGDLHCHSHRSDGRRDPAALAGYYREAGYDFLALTDHNRYYPSEELQDAYRAVPLGMTLLPGEEVHTPGSTVHIVHVGGKSSVAAHYVQEPERYERELHGYLERVPAAVPEPLRARYAKAWWATDAIRQAGGIAIFPHPYWRPVHLCYNVCDELNGLLLKSDFFDAYELMGGMGQPGNNCSLARWNDLRAEGLRLAAVASSDAHTVLEQDSTFGKLFTIVLAKGRQPAQILDAILAGHTVAVEACGEGGSLEYRCYGSLRLVVYAQFLLQSYFPETQARMCGEGVLMREYLVGEEEGSLLAAMAGRADLFYERCFGRREMALPHEERLAFEEKWRKVQLSGPATKGSGLTVRPDNGRQI